MELIKKKRSAEKISDVELPVNKYYIELSRKFKICKLVSIALLFLFVLGMISMFRNEITAENFRYFMKYLDSSSSEYTSGYQTINYNNTGVLKTELFKGDYAVVNDETLTLYSMYGVPSYSLNHKCVNPYIAKSDKYLMVYDLSGNVYNIYNAFSQLYTETLDYAISGASLADNGMYALITRTNEYRSAVYVYDQDFELVSRILKEKYIISVDFSDDGSKLIVVSVYGESGEWKTEVSVIDPYSDTESSKFTEDDKMGMSAYICPDGSYKVLYTSSVAFYSNKNDKLSEYRFGTRNPFTYCFSDDYTVLAFNNNILGNEETVTVFGKDGEIISENVFDGKINFVTVEGTDLYVLFDTLVCRCGTDGSDRVSAKIPAGCKSVIADGDRLLFVYQTYTVPYLISELFDADGGETAQ